MDNNATCQTLAVQDCLDSDGSTESLVWPARSPDLNPIENVWDALGRQIAGRKTILRQTRKPSSAHSQRNGINCLNSCWIMLCKETKTRHRVSLVSAHVTTLEEDLKQQPLCRDNNPKDVLSDSGLGDRSWPFHSFQTMILQISPQQSELGEVVHYHPIRMKSLPIAAACGKSGHMDQGFHPDI
ncbi:hypothetical protein TNCV_4973431 [Trichonephila clavipes]|uniref:Tc1-like transposase DDE domain-containing protein n=1 Tax=Trichonephila clavipes TaxID=2585209 RepID=A0A8X6VL44_TRICX|nr:hypothetical protein TNCV_4973431 [Trichonephila clavipes]